jgi:hypothetical protein
MAKFISGSDWLYVAGGLAILYLATKKNGAVAGANNLIGRILQSADKGAAIVTNPDSYRVDNPLVNSQNPFNFFNSDRPSDDLYSAIAYDKAQGGLNYLDIPYQYLRYGIRGIFQGWN